MGPGGELRLGMGDIVISGIKHNCTVTIMNNKSVYKNIDVSEAKEMPSSVQVEASYANFLAR